MNRARARFLVVISSVALIASGLIAGAPAALAAEATMGGGAGDPLSIRITDDLNCAVNHAGDTSGEFYGDTACGTFLSVNGQLYGPGSVPAGPSTTGYTPGGQSGPTGAGTSSDPYTIVTTVDVGSTGLHITQTDTYVSGQESYRTDVSVSNTGPQPVSAELYRAGDCYLQNSDYGFGAYDGTTGAVSCVAAADPNAQPPVPGDRIIQWYPISSGSHYYEAQFSEVWNEVSSGQPFTDQCLRCSEFVDNGSGLSWDISVPPGGSVRRSQITTFSPLGIQPLSTSKTADDSSVPPDSSDGYTITVHNSNVADVTLNDVTDNLPSGFSYVNNSTSDATTHAAIVEPTGTGNLTWSGPFTVPGGGDFSLHFGVVVSSTPGNYNNQAGADAANNYSVAPTGPTAQVSVEQPVGQADLSVTKTDTPDPVTEGDNVAYTVHVVNNGPDQATGVFLDDTVPPEASFVSASGTGWTCDSAPSEGHLTCDGPNLDANASTNVTLVFKAPDTAPASGHITDSVTVFDDQGSSASDDESTDVVPHNGDEGSGYVPPGGGTVTTGTDTTADDPTNASAKLPSGPGGVVTIEEQTPPANFCGNGPCRGDVVVITIPDGYDNASNPPKLRLTYDVTISDGRGPIYVQTPPGPIVRVARCLAPGVADPSPCLAHRFRLPNGDQRVVIYLLSGDPIFGKH